MPVRILHTQDFHGKLTPDRAERISRLKTESNALYFDCGDLIKAGNLAIPIAPEEAWSLLASCRCTAMVPGNRESHVLEAAVSRKFAGCETPIVCANWRHRDGQLKFPDHMIMEHEGVTIGIVGAMVPMVTERMISQAASAFLWTAPIPAITALVKTLRAQVDLLIALTHIGLSQDRLLAEQCPEIDLILGGHSHSVLTGPEIVNGVPICQGGSHGRFVGSYTIEPGRGITEAELISLTQA